MLGSGFDDAQRLVAPLVAAGRRRLGILLVGLLFVLMLVMLIWS